MSSHKKISILGSGRVGSSIAYSLILEGLCSEIVLVDIAKELAQGESYAPDAIYIIVSNPVDVPYICSTGDYRTAKRACHWNRNFQTVKKDC